MLPIQNTQSVLDLVQVRVQVRRDPSDLDEIQDSEMDGNYAGY